ncbi:MAG: hypothetical protein ACXWEY_09260 [Bacteroidia bacterium]
MPLYKYFVRVFLIVFFVMVGVITVINDNNLVNNTDASIYAASAKYYIAVISASFYTAVTYLKYWRINTRKRNLTLHL